MLPKMLPPQQENIANGALNHFVACSSHGHGSVGQYSRICNDLGKIPNKGVLLMVR